MWTKLFLSVALIFAVFVFIHNLRYVHDETSFSLYIPASERLYLEKLLDLNHTLNVLKRDMGVASRQVTSSEKVNRETFSSKLPSPTSESIGNGMAFQKGRYENIDSVQQAASNQRNFSKLSSVDGKRIIIFTMDSISDYEKNSLAGGAAGTW